MASEQDKPGSHAARVLLNRIRLSASVPRAVALLAWARLQLRSVVGRDIAERNRRIRQSCREAGMPDPDDAALLAQVRSVIPFTAKRVPWRSDCLVQALAGQEWLAARGIASRIVIGVENTEETGFGAHAWLAHGDSVVLGGSVSKFSVLLDDR